MIVAFQRFSNRCSPLTVCAALAALLTTACVSNPEPVVSKLDPRTMVTINYIKSPFIFFRARGASHAAAQDYVYIGPLEANRSGDYRYYLWLATWSSIDNIPSEQSPERLETVDLIADGKSLTLKMNGASVAAVGASEAVYPKPVGWATEVYYDLSLQQLRVIAEATDLKLRFPATGETYGPWDDQAASKAGTLEFLLRAEP
jgi:hypothetical protein